MSAAPRGLFSRPVDTQLEAARLSVESRASEHALDINYDADEQDPARRASSQNTADEANLNVLGMTGPSYKNVSGEEPFKASDCQHPKERPVHHYLVTILRGRAMPLKSVALATIWSALAVFITWITKDAKPNNYNNPGDCRWWCTFLAFDSDALSYVGFALFLLTSFRASE